METQADTGKRLFLEDQRAAQAFRHGIARRLSGMTIPELENLVRVGQIKSEPCAQSELDGLLAAGRTSMVDARNEELAPQSRFSLAYNAAHAFALAALR